MNPSRFCRVAPQTAARLTKLSVPTAAYITSIRPQGANSTTSTSKRKSRWAHREYNRMSYRELRRSFSSHNSISTIEPHFTKASQNIGLHGSSNKGRRNNERIEEQGNQIIGWGEKGVTIRIQPKEDENGLLEVTFPNVWLRDNCRCTTCVNQDTMQRAFDTFSIPTDVQAKTTAYEANGIGIKWANDEHESSYEWSWLLKHANAENSSKAIKTRKKRSFWTHDIARFPPTVNYEDIMTKGVGEWTQKIQESGFCYVDGCPISPEATKELLEQIAFIRETHYGGFYDFTADLSMKDTAYTNLALSAHTDTTYFTDPAGLQAFHLLSHTDGTGGESLLVDSFHAAHILQKEDPDAYDTLAQTPVPAHASGNEGINITPAKQFPVLNFYSSHEGQAYDKSQLMQVRWNNDDRGVLPLGENSVAEKWYDAARKFNSILNRSEMQYWAQLEPGKPLIFDNWRVMHGRAAFTGKRRICGAYINHDDYVSKWRNTNFTRNEIMDQIL